MADGPDDRRQPRQGRRSGRQAAPYPRLQVRNSNGILGSSTILPLKMAPCGHIWRVPPDPHMLPQNEDSVPTKSWPLSRTRPLQSVWDSSPKDTFHVPSVYGHSISRCTL